MNQPGSKSAPPAARRARRRSRSCPHPRPCPRSIGSAASRSGCSRRTSASRTARCWRRSSPSARRMSRWSSRCIRPMPRHTTSACTPGFRRRWPRWPRWSAPPSATDCRSWCSRSFACRHQAPGSGAARSRRAIATPGSSATATCWASWARSRASPAPRAWSSAASCRRWRTTSTTGGRSSSACAQSFRASSSIRPTGITIARQALFDLVDEEGISGYFNLREASAAADDAALEAGWRRARQRDRSLARRTLAPVHLHRARLPIAQGRHRRAVGRRSRAARPTSTSSAARSRRSGACGRPRPALDGVYIWNWYGYGGLGTTSYTPRGKPAELEVRSLLGAL